MIHEDPHAWLRPFYATVRARNAAFSHLSPHHQFELLAKAVEPEQPARAQEMQEWSDGAQLGLLLHLAIAAEQNHTSEVVELWSVRKGDRVLTCRAKHLPDGVDLQLFEGDDFRRTQLCRIAPDARMLAETWRKALRASGWTAD